MSPVERVLDKLPDAKEHASGWQARCPAHEDRRASLSINTGDDGRALIHCHAGCDFESIVAALGLAPADLMVAKTTRTTKAKPQIVAVYKYTNALGVHAFDVVRFEPKDFRQRRADGRWKMDGVTRMPYRFNELRKGQVPSCFIVEGEKDADALAAIGLPATTNPGGAGKWTAAYSLHLTHVGITRVCILPDNDGPGREHAEDVARHCLAKGIEARILELPNLPVKGDVSDWLAAGGTRDQLRELAKDAAIWTPPIGATTDSLSDSKIEPAVTAAEPLQAKPSKPKKAGQGRDVTFEDTEPAEDAVNGAELLDAIAATFRRYLALPDHAAVVLALWTLHAWCLAAAFCSALLALTSPAKRCGKTTVLVVLGALVPRRLFAANVTPAVLFRTIEKYRPTLLIDEADTFIRDNDELRGVINSGHTRTTAVVIRAVGDDHDPRAFSTWCAKSIALIGKLPDTLHDRAIEIRMRRRLPGETVARLRQDRIEDEALPLRRQAARWAADHEVALTTVDPVVPAGLNDRAADSWRPLLAIADAAGGEWPRLARDAAKALSGGEAEDDTATMLLQDTKNIFAAARNPEVLGSTAIVEALVALEDRPWGEWSQGRPLTTAKLSRLLAGYGIHSAGTVRIDKEKTVKGYRRAAFADAWTRYLRAGKASQGNNTNESGEESAISKGNNESGCDGLQSVTTPMNPGPCDGVTVSGDVDDDSELVA